MYTSRKSALGALVVMLAALGAVTPAIGQQGTIAANTITEGRLEQGDTRRDGGFVDNYRYDGEAGEELHIVLSPNMPIGRRVTIEGPGGLSAGSNSGQSDSLDVRLPQRGRYRISVSDNSNAGSYQLGVWRVTTAQNPSTLTVGQTIQGGFTSTDSMSPSRSDRRRDTYTYNAQAGETVGLRLEGQQVSAVAQISGPDNFRRTAFAEFVSTVTEPLYFRSAGAYTITVEGRGGNYTLALEPRPSVATATPVGVLAVGSSVQGRLDPRAAINTWARGQFTHVYTIDGRRGEHLAIVLSPKGVIEVIAPDGQRVSALSTSDNDTTSGWEITLPSDGQYRLGASLDGAMGDYTLQLLNAAQGNAIIADANVAAARERAERQARIVQLGHRGEQLLNSGANAEAEAAYTELLNLDPHNVTALVNRGTARSRQSIYWSAGADFSAALIEDPNNQVARQNLQVVEATQRQQRAQQQQQIAQAEIDRQEREAAVLSNAIGTFTGAYNATAEAQRQADAQARAQAEAQARAQADAQAAANARAAQQAAAPSPSASTPRPQEERVLCVAVRYDQLRAEYLYHNDCPFSVRIHTESGAGLPIASGGTGRLGTGRTPSNTFFYATRLE